MPGPEATDEYHEYVKQVVLEVPGAIAASIAGVDGISLAGYSQVPDFDFGLVDAELASMHRTSQKASRGMTAGEVGEVVVVCANATFIVHPIGDEFYLSITLKSEKGLGMARVVARRMAGELKQALV